MRRYLDVVFVFLCNAGDAGLDDGSVTVGSGPLSQDMFKASGFGVEEYGCFPLLSVRHVRIEYTACYRSDYGDCCAGIVSCFIPCKYSAP